MENDKCTMMHGSDESEEESENGAGIKSTSQSGYQLNMKNNLDVSRSSSSASLVSSSQTDDLVKNNCFPKEDPISNDEAEVVLEDVEKIVTRNLPLANVPEKIILCIDTVQDPEFTPFTLGNGSKHAPLSMVKRVAQIFINSKNIINPKHEFALVVLQSDNVEWLQEFTRDPRAVVSVLEDITESPQSETFDLSSLFDLIKCHVTLPTVDEPSVTAPAYVLRVVLLYSRSYCLPEFKHGRESFNFLTSSQYFTLDTLYIHEDPSANNRCEQIYKMLDDLDEQGFSYVFDVQRNATTLHQNMAKLLAHPLQRPQQKLASYKLTLQESQ